MKALLAGLLTFSVLAIAVELRADCGEVPPPPICIVVSGATWNPVTYSYETSAGKTVSFAAHPLAGGIPQWTFGDGGLASGSRKSTLFLPPDRALSLVIANVIPDFLSSPSSLAVTVEAFSPEGEPAGFPVSYSLASGETRFIPDVLGVLAVGEMTGGQVRVTKRSSGGLLWGELAVTRADGTRSVVAGFVAAPASPFGGVDSIILPGVGVLGRWDTEITVTNPTDFPIAGQIARVSTECPRCPIFSLEPRGSSTLRLSDSLAGIGVDAYRIIPIGSGLPIVSARILNLDQPTVSADVPVIGESGASSNLSGLSFPGATRHLGSRADLFLANLGAGTVLIRIEVRSQGGQLLGSTEKALALGEPLFFLDVLAQLGVEDLEEGQIRVISLSTDNPTGLGFIAGEMSLVSSTSGFSIVSGINP